MEPHNPGHLGRLERRAPVLLENRGFPYDPDNEKYVIGGIVTADDPTAAFHRVRQLLGPSDFSLDQTRLIFVAMEELVAEGLPLDDLSLRNRLVAKGQVQRADSLIVALKREELPKIHRLDSACKPVADHARRRRLFSHYDSLMARLLNGADPLEQIISDDASMLSLCDTCYKAPFAPVRAKPPESIGDAARYGVPGEVLKLMMPHTESGEAALLVQFLVTTGIFIGRTGYYLAEGDRHYTNLFAALVGGTSTGRKGTSWSRIRQLYELTDEQFINKRRKSGMASGEGLIWQVRDEIHEQHAIKEKNRTTGYEDVIVDQGVEDKRLLVQEPEFARALKNVQRRDNILSAVIRDAFDTGTLHILTKSRQAEATNAHIGIISHITSEEVNRLLTDTEAANGFANRFMWVFAERSKVLPFGGTLRTEDLEPFAKALHKIRSFAQGAGATRINFDEQARADWPPIYSRLTAGRPGLLGAILARGHVHVLRLATLWALLDCDDIIRRPHLQAAVAVWEYAQASAVYIFGAALGDDTADTILDHLRSADAAGMTRTEIHAAFKRNRANHEITRALGVLFAAGLAYPKHEPRSHGAPAERWFAGRDSISTSYEINEINEINGHGPGSFNSFNSSLRIAHQ